MNRIDDGCFGVPREQGPGQSCIVDIRSGGYVLFLEFQSYSNKREDGIDFKNVSGQKSDILNEKISHWLNDLKKAI
jgi:hypothetical protein